MTVGSPSVTTFPGSSPELTIDPVVMASSLVMKLQTIRSRELAGDVPAIITVGFVNAGVKHNVIPDEAHIGLSIRTQSTIVQQQIIDAIRRMAEAEAQATPEITTSDEVPLTSNCEAIDQRIRAVHASLLGSDHIVELPTMMFSEDFSQYGLPGRHHYDGEPIPYCYWVFGGHSQERYAAPGDSFITKLTLALQPSAQLCTSARIHTSSRRARTHFRSTRLSAGRIG